MLKDKISEDRWKEAQNGELACHVHESVESSYKNYESAYKYYFKYLDINPDLNGKSIIEVGPARIAALLFCEKYSKSYIVEPIAYDGVSYLYEGKDIEFIRESFENCEIPKCDEVWLLNVLQHVKDPDVFVETAKRSADIIRFFEPINTEVNNEHPFTFSLEDYKYYFGECVKHYTHSGEPFHTADCAYGVYKKV